MRTYFRKVFDVVETERQGRKHARRVPWWRHRGLLTSVIVVFAFSLTGVAVAKVLDLAGGVDDVTVITDDPTSSSARPVAPPGVGADPTVTPSTSTTGESPSPGATTPSVGGTTSPADPAPDDPVTAYPPPRDPSPTAEPTDTQDPRPTPPNRPTKTPKPTKPAHASCDANIEMLGQWSGGFTAKVIMTNTGEHAADDWWVTFDLPYGYEVQSAWGGRSTGQGSNAVIEHTGNDTTIDAGDAHEFGFLARGRGSADTPTNFALNNTTCA